MNNKFKLMPWFAVIVGIIVALSVSNAQAQATATPDEDTYAARDIEIELRDGYTTKAQLTTPLVGDAPFPTVILIHGSGFWDMDATNPAPDGTIISANFKRLAAFFAQEGIATLRYNKRGVLGNGEFDQSQFQAASQLSTLIADATDVLAFAQEQPEVATDALYLYGWSEGTWVASHIANTQPDDLAGAILHAPPNQGTELIIEYQHIELGLPYLRTQIDADANGALSIEEILTIPQGPVALMPSFYMWSFTSTPQNPDLNPMTDTNGDGEIGLEEELPAAIDNALLMVGNFDDGLSRENSALLGEINVPVLIVHGDTDGYVPLTEGQSIADALGDQATLISYEGLGHALSLTEKPAEDGFGVMVVSPIQDVIMWILNHTDS